MIDADCTYDDATERYSECDGHRCRCQDPGRAVRRAALTTDLRGLECRLRRAAEMADAGLPYYEIEAVLHDALGTGLEIFARVRKLVDGVAK